MKVRIKVKRSLRIPTGFKVRLSAGKELTIPIAGGPAELSHFVLTEAELDELRSLIERGAVEWVCR